MISPGGTATVQVGDKLPDIVKGPITRQQLVMYAGASGDFHPQHYDDEYARNHGLPGVIAHGMLLMAFAGQVVTSWAGTGGEVKKLGARFLGIVRLGDTLRCSGTVTSVRNLENEMLVDCSLSVVRQDGQQVVQGWATVCFPLVRTQ